MKKTSELKSFIESDGLNLRAYTLAMLLECRDMYLGDINEEWIDIYSYEPLERQRPMLLRCIDVVGFGQCLREKVVEIRLFCQNGYCCVTGDGRDVDTQTRATAQGE